MTSPPEVNYHLLGLLGVEGKVVCFAPRCQLLHLFSVGRLIAVGDEADNCGVVGELYDVVGVETSRTVMRQQCKQ